MILKNLKQLFLNYSSPQYYYLQNSIKDFSKRLGPISLLIDIGCGYSPFTKKFSAKKCVLIDLKEKGDVNFLSDVQFLAIRNCCTDLVLFTEVLEHVKDEKKALSEIYRILRPGGSLILSVPFLFGMHESTDYRRWTAQGIKELLKEHHFNIIDFHTRGGCFSSLVVLWRNMPRELLGGDFRSVMAKVFSPLLGLHFLVCTLLTPLAIFLDMVDKVKFSSTGYIVLCRKTSE